jgi:hypothetical protein
VCTARDEGLIRPACFLQMADAAAAITEFNVALGYAECGRAEQKKGADCQETPLDVEDFRERLQELVSPGNSSNVLPQPGLRLPVLHRLGGGCWRGDKAAVPGVTWVWS